MHTGFGSRMLVGVEVHLCLTSQQCSLCGVVPGEIDRGQWGYIQCGQEAQSKTVNEVVVTNPLTPLTFCEVEIYGDQRQGMLCNNSRLKVVLHF